MKMNIVVRYEMMMSQEEVEVLMLICNPEDYAYGYHYVNENEWQVVVEDEAVLEEMADELWRYICNVDVDYEMETREIKSDEWEIYDIAREIRNMIME